MNMRPHPPYGYALPPEVDRGDPDWLLEQYDEADRLADTLADKAPAATHGGSR